MTHEPRTPPHGHYLSAAYPHEQENVVTQPVPAKSTTEPVLKAARVWGGAATLIVTVIGILVGLGVLSQAEADAISLAVDQVSSNLVPVGVAIVGITSLVSGIAGSLATAFSGRRRTVPTDSDAFDIIPKPPVV